MTSYGLVSHFHHHHSGLFVGGSKMLAVDLSTGVPLTDLIHSEMPFIKAAICATHAAGICQDLVIIVNLKTGAGKLVITSFQCLIVTQYPKPKSRHRLALSSQQPEDLC